jgi:uncharacterized phage-like protein YoqJ
MITIAVTGHRPSKLGGHWDPRLYLPVIERLARHLEEKAKAEPITLISGMALGWDMIAAAAAVIAKDRGAPITLICAVPFEGQHKRWTDATSVAWYWRLRERADKVVVVSKGGYDRTLMLKRNEWMVEQADMVLACWDGSDGGTGHCVHYAQMHGRKVVNVYANYFPEAWTWTARWNQTTKDEATAPLHPTQAVHAGP